MKKIRVALRDRSYDIVIKHRALSEVGKYLSNAIKLPKKGVLISNRKVYSLYGDKVLSNLQKSGFNVKMCLVKDGEGAKSSDVAFKIYEFLIKNKMNRNSFLIALGGGVVGDLTGYVAATYMRGIPFIQIPTTLLSQVDSSVGGKVAINIPHGKNLIGSFYQPKFVLIDPHSLKTLPEKEWINGMAEVIKYGLIRDKKFFNFLIKFHKNIKKQAPDILETMIYESIKHKAFVVSKDEKEKGLRAILNFGHTFGHAIEKTWDYKKYSHGEAVSVGMAMASLFSLKKGFLKIDEWSQIYKGFQLFDLPCALATKKAKIIYDNLFYDKKMSDKGLNLILIKNIGRVFIKEFEESKEIKSFINEFCSENNRKMGGR